VVSIIEELGEGLGRFGVHGRLRLRIEQLPVDLATGPQRQLAKSRVVVYMLGVVEPAKRQQKP